MAAPERADDTSGAERSDATPEQGEKLLAGAGAIAPDDAIGVARDESGTRLRLDPAPELDEDEQEALEVVEVVAAPRRRVVPPPPPRAPRRERVDLDELLRGVARSSMPLGPAMAPARPEPPLAPPPRAAAPALPPPIPEPAVPAPPSRPQWGIAIVVGTTGVVVGAITAVALLLTAGPASHPERAGAAKIVPAPPAPAAETRRGGANVAGEASSATAAREAAPVALTEPPAPAAIEPARVVERRSAGRRRRASVRRAPERAPSRDAVADPAPRPEAPSGAPAPAAIEPEPAATAPEPAAEPSPALPEHPSRADVDAAVERVLPGLRACGQGMDLVTIELHFASSGRATTATIHARHLTPVQRSCLARAARGARVPAFSASHLSVRYPVRL